MTIREKKPSGDDVRAAVREILALLVLQKVRFRYAQRVGDYSILSHGASFGDEQIAAGIIQRLYEPEGRRDA